MKKFAIIYGHLENEIQKRAVEELSSMLLDYTFEYPTCFQYDENANTCDYKRIYIGTKQNASAPIAGIIAQRHASILQCSMPTNLKKIVDKITTPACPHE